MAEITREAKHPHCYLLKKGISSSLRTVHSKEVLGGCFKATEAPRVHLELVETTETREMSHHLALSKVEVEHHPRATGLAHQDCAA